MVLSSSYIIFKNSYFEGFFLMDVTQKLNSHYIETIGEPLKLS